MAASRADRIVYRAEARELQYHVHFGDDMYGVLDQHTQLTGRPALPPRWSLGNLQSKFGYQSFDEIQGIIDEFRSRQIPLDAVIMDLDWFGIETMGNLDFQQTPAWANPVDRIDAIQAQGIKLIPITEPPVTGFSFNAQTVLDQGLVGRLPDGVTPYDVPLDWITTRAPIYLLDFTNPATRQWWSAQHALLIDGYGFDGFWQDLNEPEGQQDDMVYHAGAAVEVGNVIALNMIRALDEAMALHRPGGRTFILSRSGYPGMQRHGACVWSGDVFSSWFDLSRQPALAANMGLAGVPQWNSDIGGFNGTPSPELYLRWCQFGAFNPIYRPHGAHSDREPWRFGPEVENAARDLLTLRYTLIPHLYTVAREAHMTGAPIMRPLVMDWPSDPAARDLDTQYLYGPHLMVRPVTEPSVSSVQVYLPEGTWVDWFTGERHDGPSTFTHPVRMDTYPLLVRAPAIIPLGPPVQTSDERPLDEVTLRVYLPSEAVAATGQLYEDDGLTTAHLQGEHMVTHFSATETPPIVLRVDIGPGEGSHAGAPDSRRYTVDVWDVSRPAGVSHDGAVLPEHMDLEAFHLAGSGWHHDSEMNRLRAKGEPVAVSAGQRFEILDEFTPTGILVR
jgi:alpha-glucosidase (family GH31 glycosyl hydrolase)